MCHVVVHLTLCVTLDSHLIKRKLPSHKLSSEVKLLTSIFFFFIPAYLRLRQNISFSASRRNGEAFKRVYTSLVSPLPPCGNKTNFVSGRFFFFFPVLVVYAGSHCPSHNGLSLYLATSICWRKEIDPSAVLTAFLL